MVPGTGHPTYTSNEASQRAAMTARWSPRRPSDDRLRAFLAAQTTMPFSYTALGATRTTAPPGYRTDCQRTLLGAGAATFDAACGLLRRWRMFPSPWTAIVPPDAPLEPGSTVAVLVWCGGWWWNAARIVYVIAEPRRFGFAYGTLRDHAESGEERFLVEWDETDRVWYSLRAFSRPQFLLGWVGYPFLRLLQRRFRHASGRAMRRGIRQHHAAARP